MEILKKLSSKFIRSFLFLFNTSRICANEPVSACSGNEVKVKMLFAPINPADLNMVQGSYPTQPPLPAVAGNEGVAQVVEVGPAAKNLKVGDLVLPINQGFGTFIISILIIFSCPDENGASAHQNLDLIILCKTELH